MVVTAVMATVAAVEAAAAAAAETQIACDMHAINRVNYGTKMETNVFNFTVFFLVCFSFFPQFPV